MGPIRYLWLRRMHLARRELCLADPATTTVTQIATRFGFWELGRFAVSYRRLFGEPPSVSLHRGARGQPRPENRPSDFADFGFS
jgi:AraC-like DNA-binding protein